jgi:pentatricopeptide repeat domain-containing protein 1
MKREGVAPGMIVYTCLLQTCIRSKQIHKALSIYEDMKIQGVRGDKVTFNTLVNGCVYAKQLDSAYAIAQDSFSLNVRLAEDVYNNLLRNLISSRDPSKIQWAADLCHQMKRKGIEPEYSLYSQLVKNLYGEAKSQPKSNAPYRRPVLAEKNF